MPVIETEIRVAVIDITQLTEEQQNTKDYHDISNEEFYTIAEEQGTVFTISGFTNAFNETEVSTTDDVIRFIPINIDTGMVIEKRLNTIIVRE